MNKQWELLKEPGWSPEQLTAALDDLRGKDLSSFHILWCWDRIQEAKTLDGLNEAQHVALAKAGLATAKRLAEVAQDPAAAGFHRQKLLGRVIHAARDACRAVREPSALKLAQHAEVRASLMEILSLALTHAEGANDHQLNLELKIPDLTLEICEFVCQELDGSICNQAENLRLRLAGSRGAKLDELRNTERYRSYLAVQSQLRAAQTTDAELAAGLDFVASFMEAETWFIALAQQTLTGVLGSLIKRFGKPDAIDRYTQLASAVGRFTSIVAANVDKIPDGDGKLHLLHRALLLSWFTLRARGLQGRRAHRFISSSAFQTAQKFASPSAVPKILKLAGEIAAIRLHEVPPSKRRSIAEQGCDWFQWAHPGGFDAESFEPHVWHAWLECLQATHRYVEAEKAIVTWLPIAVGKNSSPARKLLLHRAELKLARIEALCTDSTVEDIEELKSILTAAARRHDPAAEPDSACLTRHADAIVHYRLGQLYFALEKWPEAERQLGFALQLQPPSADSSRRVARALALTLLAKARIQQNDWRQAESAYADAQRSYWSTLSLAGQLCCLRELGWHEAWIDLATQDPPKGALIQVHTPLEDEILTTLQSETSLRGQLLKRCSSWLPRRFLPVLLCRALHIEHPLSAELWTVLSCQSYLPLNGQLLLQHLISTQYELQIQPFQMQAALEMVVRPLEAHADADIDLAEIIHTALRSTLQAALRSFALTAIKHLQEENLPALNQLLRGDRWQNEKPSAYRGLDRFSLSDRLRRWLAQLEADLPPGWSGRFEDGERWIRGSSWLELRGELERAFAANGAALSNFFVVPGEKGGMITFRLNERLLLATVRLNEGAVNGREREEIEDKLNQWKRSVPNTRSPRFALNVAGTMIELRLIIGGSAPVEPPPLVREIQRQIERLLAGEQSSPLAFDTRMWLDQTDNYRTERGVSLLYWLHDYATMRIRLWLVEEHATDVLRHPRLVLHHLKDAAEIEFQPGVYVALMYRFLHQPMVPSRPLNFTRLVREIVARRRTKNGNSQYQVDVEPGCLVSVDDHVAEVIVNALLANSENNAIGGITVTVASDLNHVRLSITNPCDVGGGSPRNTGAGIGHSAARWVARVHQGRFEAQFLDGGRSYRAELSFPVAFLQESKSTVIDVDALSA